MKSRSRITVQQTQRLTLTTTLAIAARVARVQTSAIERQPASAHQRPMPCA